MKNTRFFRDIHLGVKTLMLHKLRSLLTMLGVVFGVGSVIAMLAVGEGASREALAQIRKLGSNNIIIDTAKPSDDSASGTKRTRISIYGLKYADDLRIAECIPSIKRTVPVKIIRKEGRLGSKTLPLRLVGTTPAWFELVKRPLLAGRELSDGDLKKRTNVAVLTEHGARRLLATEETLGSVIKIGGNAFMVVGIIQSDSGNAGGMQTPDRDTDAYIPLTTARERFGDVYEQRSDGASIRESVELHQIIAEAVSLADVEPAAQAIEAMLTRFNKQKSYRLQVPLALLRQAEATKRNYNIVLGSIAGISLLVGGIGIMNIMLASVTERTREIGIRRAIGAKRRQIIAQFLIETVVLSMTGGAIGVGIGVLIPWIITRTAGMPTLVTPLSVIVSLGVSMLVGMIFGIYPAVRAARLDPIEALRHE